MKKEKPNFEMKVLDGQPPMPKMRIALLNNNLAFESDRLVTQSIEFNKGPKDKHSGPIRVEFTLVDKADAESAQKYLGQLMLDLPINEVKEKKASKKKISLLDEDSVKEFYHEIKAKFMDKTQDNLIGFLREKGFVFRTADFLKLFGVPIKIKKSHGRHQFMIRAIKVAKNPKADKYDPQLVFAFKLGKVREGVVKVYLYKKFYEVLSLDWSDKGKTINYTKKELLVFPAYLNEADRLKFSTEHRKLKMSPELKPSKFYLRWKDDVKLR